MNEGIVFDNPWVLLGLVVFIPIFLYDKFSPGKKRIYKLLPGYLKRKLFVSKLFFRLFIAFGIIALSTPRWGIWQAPAAFNQSTDAVIALDLSRSMETADIKVDDDIYITRIERALDIIKETVSALPSIRYAVAFGKGKGMLAIPLTYDNNAILDFLYSANGLTMTGSGTNLESILDAAVEAFMDTANNTKIIILVSDGEELFGNITNAVQQCRKNGIRITAVPVGTEEGAIVPVIVPGTEEIHSRRNTENMLMAASRTGGIMVEGNNEGSANELISYLRSFSSDSETVREKYELKPRWYLFVILAIITFGLNKLSLLKLDIRKKR